MSKNIDTEDNTDKWKKLAESLEKEDVSEAESQETSKGSEREALENRLTVLEQQLAEAKELALRTKAEMENQRRKAEREVLQAHQYGNKSLLNDLLPVADSFTHALQMKEIAEHSQVKEGLERTLDLLHNTLSKHGVTLIPAKVGDVFDPHLHEAMSIQHNKEAKDNTILQVVQNGYQLQDRVLRAALVIVNKL